MELQVKLKKNEDLFRSKQNQKESTAADVQRFQSKKKRMIGALKAKRENGKR